MTEAHNKGQKFPAEVLTAEEINALIGQCSPTAATGVRNRAMLTLMYRSGLRVSEVVALRISDVNLTKRTIRVLHGKGDKATTRGLHPSAIDAVARWLDTIKRLGIKAARLFCTLKGAELHPQYLRNLMGRLRSQAGIAKRCNPHGARHTFANDLREGGADVAVISKLLGHSSISVTSIYLDHLSPAGAIEALGDVELSPIG
jgi:integrase/recombinase XerD